MCLCVCLCAIVGVRRRHLRADPAVLAPWLAAACLLRLAGCVLSFSCCCLLTVTGMLACLLTRTCLHPALCAAVQTAVVTTTQDTPLVEAAAAMKLHGIGGMPVVDGGYKASRVGCGGVGGVGVSGCMAGWLGGWAKPVLLGSAACSHSGTAERGPCSAAIAQRRMQPFTRGTGCCLRLRHTHATELLHLHDPGLRPPCLS